MDFKGNVLITTKEREQLTYLASQVMGGVVVEIGSFRGDSTYALAQGTDKPVYAIDMWDLIFSTGNTGRISLPKFGVHSPEIYKAFCDKTKGKNIIGVKGISSEIAKVWNMPIGLLFIDGDHRYAGVMSDYNGFAKHIIQNGYLVFHDYGHAITDVTKAVDEIKTFPIWTDWQRGGIKLIWAKRA